MIKLKKYHLYKVKYIPADINYLTVYLGKSKTPLTYNHKTHYQLWSLGETDSIQHRKTFRKRIYKWKTLGTPISPQPFNNEHTVEVLEEIPLSSIKMSLWELTSSNTTAGSVLYGMYSKPKTKDYSKMRVLNG